MVAEADGIFMTGGDQKRLMAIIGGTALDAEMHTALKVRGACIAGTSAGARERRQALLPRAVKLERARALERDRLRCPLVGRRARRRG